MSRKQVDEEHPFVLHTRRELMLMGKDEDFIEWAVEVVKAYLSFGHSGMSHYTSLSILLKLLKGDNLTKLTDRPDEWRDVSKYTGEPTWQNKRNSKAFSNDGGKTFHLLSETDTKTAYSADHIKTLYDRILTEAPWRR